MSHRRRKAGAPTLAEVGWPEQRPVVPGGWRWWLAAVLAAGAAAVVYLPTLDNGFVTWDDPDYITKNEHVTKPEGLARIWNPREKHEQYYPLVFTSYWLEYRAWGPEPRGYHLTNLVLHALNTFVLVWLLRLLGLTPWAAWLAASLFALHPVNVASVAWAAERKNVLSGLFFLLSLACYLRNTRRPHLLVYGGSLLLFAAGLLSKTAVVTLPATAVLCDRVVLGRWSGRSFLRILPMLAIGMVAAIHTHTVEQGASTSVTPLELPLRPLVAAGALWFYLGKLAVPVGLAGVYPRWDVAASWPVSVAALAALLAVAVVGWKLRRRVSPLAYWGAGHYVLALTPMLGLISFNFTQYSFVADHFVYIPAIGVFVAVAAGADALRCRLGREWGPALAASLVVAVPLAVLGGLAWRQGTAAWKDGQTFWEHTVALNPRCFAGHYNLGNLFAREGDWARAGEHYRLATVARPEMHLAWGQWAKMRERLGQREEALDVYRQAIERVPLESKSWVDYRHAAADLFIMLGRPDEAEEYLRQTVAEKPWLFRAQMRMGEFLQSQRRYDEALNCYEQILRTEKSDTTRAAAQREINAIRKLRGS